MKTEFAKLFLFTQKINRQHVQVAFGPESDGTGPHFAPESDGTGPH
jgi:hypothetical protein